MNRTVRTGVLLAFGTALVSGISVFVNSYGVKAFGDATVYTTAKNAVAGLLLGVATVTVGFRDRATAVTRPIRRTQWAWLAVIGIVGGSVPFVLFFEGLARATSGPVQAQFLNKTLVVWVALLAIPLLGERLGLLQLAAVGLLVVGQAALAGGVTALGHLSFGSGEVMILGATGLWAVEVVLAKRLLRELGSWTVALARMVLGSALLVGWVVIRGKGDLLVGMSGRQWGWVLVTGMLLFVYVATWLAALSRAPAVAVTAVLVAAVPVTALLQVLAGQPVPASKMGGLTIIVVGCALAAVAMLRDSRPRTSPAAR